jgi:N-acylneuraminate cytidylyltransferase
MIKAFVIIPAKGDSKRLVGKNKRVIAGKTLLEHSIEYAKKSTLASSIIVSTEDEETKNIAESYGVEVVGRDKDFMGEREVADVYIKIFQEYGDNTFTHVVGI